MVEGGGECAVLENLSIKLFPCQSSSFITSKSTPVSDGLFWSSSRSAFLRSRDFRHISSSYYGVFLSPPSERSECRSMCVCLCSVCAQRARGRGQGHMTPYFWALTANSTKRIKPLTSDLTCILTGTVQT